MKYFVSRQCYWGEDDPYMVEIAKGGIDYANADMLGVKYAKLGEGSEYDDPREAVKAALAIAKQWRLDDPSESINVGCGYTGGNSIPFEPSDEDELNEWANKEYDSIPKCTQCGDPLPKEYYYDPFIGDDPDYRYCSEYCTEQSMFIDEDEDNEDE